MTRLPVAALTGTAIPTFWLSRRYRRDMKSTPSGVPALQCSSCMAEARSAERLSPS